MTLHHDRDLQRLREDSLARRLPRLRPGAGETATGNREHRWRRWLHGVDLRDRLPRVLAGLLLVGGRSDELVHCSADFAVAFAARVRG
jgi:hypothetical protein